MKTSKTKKRFVLSLVAVIACVAMLIGTTFAWFTDSVSNTGNKIQAGTLDVELWQKQGDEFVNISNSTEPVYGYDKWEPGYSTPNAFEVRNNGNLALKYKLSFNLVDSKTGIEQLNADYPGEAAKSEGQQSQDYKDKLAHLTKCGATTKLEDVLVVYRGTETDDINDNNKIGTLSEVLAGTKTLSEGQLLAKGAANNADKETMGFIVKMPEEAGNEYENASITFDINLVATQLNYENDGFNNPDYDKKAEYPIVTTAKFKPITSSDQTEDLEIQKVGIIKAAKVSAETANDVFDGLKDEDAVSNELILTLQVVENGQHKVEDESKTTTTVDLDINMKGVMKSTALSGHVTTSTKEVKEMQKYEFVEIEVGKNLSGVKATHNGEAMIESENTDEDEGQGVYSYNSETGILKLQFNRLSPFAYSYDVPFIAQIGNTKYKTLVEANNAAKSGNEIKIIGATNESITLANGVSLGNYLADPTKYTGTITITNHDSIIETSTGCKVYYGYFLKACDSSFAPVTGNVLKVQKDINQNTWGVIKQSVTVDLQNHELKSSASYLGIQNKAPATYTFRNGKLTSTNGYLFQFSYNDDAYMKFENVELSSSSSNNYIFRANFSDKAGKTITIDGANCTEGLFLLCQQNKENIVIRNCVANSSKYSSQFMNLYSDQSDYNLIISDCTFTASNMTTMINQTNNATYKIAAQISGTKFINNSNGSSNGCLNSLDKDSTYTYTNCDIYPGFVPDTGYGAMVSKPFCSSSCSIVLNKCNLWTTEAYKSYCYVANNITINDCVYKYEAR